MEWEKIVIALIGSALTALMWLKDRQKRKAELERINLENEKLQIEIARLHEEKADISVKLSFIDRIMDIPFFNELAHSINRIFKATKADRFLILIAKNGSKEFNLVTVVFEQHKNDEYKINAIRRYRNVDISEDMHYKQMLRNAERKGVQELDTSTMPNCLLKQFYLEEKVTHSKVRFLLRKPIDAKNDFVVFSSLATHNPVPFSIREKVFVKTEYEGTIIPALKEVVN